MIDSQILKQNNEYGDGSSRKNKIKLDDGNDTSGNIRDINITFYRVWRNLVIRNEILFHTRLFNIHLGKRISFTLEELPTYKYKSYLDMAMIYNKKKNRSQETQKFMPLFSNVIPYSVSEVSFYSVNMILNNNSIPNTVTTVSFYSTPIKQEFTKGILPDSITCLRFDWGSLFNQSLAGGWLPNSLQSLLLTSEFQQDIGVNQLPESLTELNFISYIGYKGRIEPGSIPSIAAAKPWDYTWNCECKKELTNQESSKIPISTTEYGFGQCIKDGDIPHNAISIKFSKLFKGDIQGPLPASLKLFYLENSNYFGSISNVGNVLSSSNLTSIDMGSYNLPLPANLFPQSITSIKFYTFDQPIPEGYFYNYTNLKSLVFFLFNQVIPDKTLPPSLTLLNLGSSFNKVITENTLPPSLTSLSLGFHSNHLLNVLPTSLSTLKFGYYQHTLNLNALPASLSTLGIDSSLFKLEIGQTLPSSITSLSLRTEHSIPVGSLPCNLKVLYINNPNYIHDLTEEGILPNSIQSIYFDCIIDKNYINNLKNDFFKNYIRFTK